MKYTEKDLTPWFPGDIKPKRVGVYQRRDSGGWSTFSYWSGGKWMYSHTDLEEALQFGSGQFASRYQTREWRGLTLDALHMEGMPCA